jgi:hypothetical protein
MLNTRLWLMMNNEKLHTVYILSHPVSIKKHYQRAFNELKKDLGTSGFFDPSEIKISAG